MESLKIETMLADQTVLNQCDRIARNLARDVDIAKDISQTALLKLWEDRVDYDSLFDYATVDYETAFFRQFWIIAKQALATIRYQRGKLTRYTDEHDQAVEVEHNTAINDMYDALPEHLHDLLTDMLNSMSIQKMARKYKRGDRTISREIAQIKNILAPIMLEITVLW